jgi:hypothetical protein
VGADHLRGQLLRRVSDGRARVVGQLRADDYGGILLLFGQEDADTASPSSKATVNKVDPPLRYLPSSIAQEAPGHLHRRPRTQKRAGVQYHRIPL